MSIHKALSRAKPLLAMQLRIFRPVEHIPLF
ncbi:hypothetical protein OCH239_03625 [Roseivivax halodurans JCM 10272]|uniref:Uncharacterized protein n=1 Tax=Roseivivax halodurans JCM 10272 TaxID=1449350 RepID=X7EF08_9RHOB|nr:hypothetical protein OCH239_03625 [Roseivivax halodurans JCM 10272]